ncbi:LysR substrate-binding domain-containing protein [Aquincola sp. MAHUQ-54]|uniref:LysR substrate-binding domain-containing protein n=1 Tax=Aquincola agrisoli TaxID=3119538 RepID=A0AAW9Q5U4_9BURK
MREAHLRDFIAVIESGSVRAAARKLGLTQAAVSKNVSALERQLGVPLLSRSAHGVEITAHGRVVLRRARAIDAELRHLQDELGAMADRQPHYVSVGLSSTAESLLLPTALLRFQACEPEVVVSITGGRSANNIAALREGRIDFAVGPATQEPTPTDLHVERLLSTDLAVVAREGHPLAGAASIAELGGCSWAFAVRAPDGLPPITGIFERLGMVAPKLSAHCDSFSALVALLMQSDVVTLTTLGSVQPYLRPGVLCRVPVAERFPPVVQQLITLCARPMTPWAQALAAEFRRASRRHRR